MPERENDPSGGGPVESRRVYSGRVIALDVDTARGPDGRLRDVEVVRHPGASAILPVLSSPTDADPLILLIRQYRHAANGFLHEIPAGRIEPLEDPVDCARRELLEETGYLAGHVEPLLSFYSTPGFTDERIHAFVATELRLTAPSPEADEVIEAVPIPLSAAIRMIGRGEITDAKTIATLLFASRFRFRI